jgi:two-component sensor histidine kinase
MKVKQHIWFWILQVVGWGIPASLNTFAKYFSKTDLHKTYILLEGLLFLSAGIISSSLLRFYLKKNIRFNKISKDDVLKILIPFIVASFIFSAIIFISIPTYNHFHEKPLELKTIFFVANVLNAFIFTFFWLLFYFIIKIVLILRKNRIENLELTASLKESQLNTLKGQINPHFMFNSLNNIRGLMLEDVEKSREMITRLSEMLRYSLTKNSVNKISVAEELEMVDNYIALSKIQLEKRLGFDKHIDAELLSTEIPPMIIQMLIENAVKHGISNLPKGGKVTLDIFKKADFFYIYVRNTGRLVTKKESTKVGLINIKKRLHLLYGKTSNFSLTEKDNEVIAEIKMPLSKS